MIALRNFGVGLALVLVLTPAAAQVTVPAGTVVSLGGAALNVACADVSIGGSLATSAGQLVGARHVSVAGGGTLDGGSGVIGLAGNFSLAGTFAAGTGAVQIGDGCGTATSTFTGASSFYAFSAGTATGRSLVFPASQTQAVTHSLTLIGAAAALVTIRSNSAGVAGNLALANGASQTIGYVDVADNHATVQQIGLGTAASLHSVKGSNSDGWFQTSLITEFPAGAGDTRPWGITPGPDGNLWFAESQGDRIGRITTSGAVTEFFNSATAGSHPTQITAGPDGNLWFVEQNGLRVGRITPLGVSTEFNISGAAFDIAAGPDGNLWFTIPAGRIGQITPVGVVTEFTAGISPGALPYGIVAGPDGNLWFTENGANKIGRITPAGVVTEFSAGITARANLQYIAAGPDGNLWFTEFDATQIGRITPSGVVTEFSAGTPGTGPYGIAVGPDGNLWFTEFPFSGNRIGRMTPSGVLTEFSDGLTPGSGPLGIAAGPDGAMWFAEWYGNRIGRLSIPIAAPALQSVKSRKTHGMAGTFDLPLQ